MKQSKYSFCNFRGYESVIKSLADYFNHSDFTGIYKDLSDCYNEVMKYSHEGFIYNDRKLYSPKSNELKKSYNDSDLVGLDLPSILRNIGVMPKGNVIIIGIDPLRKLNDFESKLKYNKEDLIIGTPYAFHSSFYREKKSRTKVYFDLVQKILDKEYNVYCTDLFKIWIKNKTEGKIIIKGKDKDCFINLLFEEIKIIKPSHILLFGEELKKELKWRFEKSENLSDLKNIKIIIVPHPSNSNNSTWRKEFQDIEKTCTPDNKIQYIIDKMEI